MENLESVRNILCHLEYGDAVSDKYVDKMLNWIDDLLCEEMERLRVLRESPFEIEFLHSIKNEFLIDENILKLHNGKSSYYQHRILLNHRW